MLSNRDVIVTGSTVLGLDTVTVKVKLPPGADRLIGLADLVTPICGNAVGGVMVTVALAVEVAVLPLVSVPSTVTMSVWLAPALPVNAPVKLHDGEVAPGARVVPMRLPQVEPGRVARLP